MHLKISSLAAIIPFLATLTLASPQLLPPNDPNACQSCTIIRSACIPNCSIAAYNTCVARAANSGPCMQCYTKLPSLRSPLPVKEKRSPQGGLTTPITKECQICQDGKKICATRTTSAVGYLQCNADLALDQNCLLCQTNGCTLTG